MTQPPLARISRRRFSFVWFLPVLAVLGLGAVIYYQTNHMRGPEITITFTQAEGLRPGDELRHRGITIGVVRTATLTESLDAVRVKAELRPDAARLARSGTRFWVVRPEVSLSRVAGLETLLGPRYIAVQPAEGSSSVRTFSFVGLDSPPMLVDATDSDALMISLSVRQKGSLTPGSPVLYRDIPVGFVRTVVLADDATHVEISAVIDPKYAPLVRANSRFWVASGVGLDWGLFSGLSIRADSLDSLIQGAVAFTTPKKPGLRVGAGHTFEVAPEVDSDWLKWEPVIPIGNGPVTP